MHAVVVSALIVFMEFELFLLEIFYRPCLWKTLLSKLSSEFYYLSIEKLRSDFSALTICILYMTHTRCVHGTEFLNQLPPTPKRNSGTIPPSVADGLTKLTCFFFIYSFFFYIFFRIFSNAFIYLFLFPKIEVISSYIINPVQN